MDKFKEYFNARKKDTDLESAYIRSIECVKKIDKMGNAKLFKPSEYEVQHIMDFCKKIQFELATRKPTIKEELLKEYNVSLEFDELSSMKIDSLYDCRKFFVEYNKSLEVLMKTKMTVSIGGLTIKEFLVILAILLIGLKIWQLL